MDGIRMPAVALAAVPGRRRAILDLAKEVESRGFDGIYCASVGDCVGLCLALALTTERIPIGTAIANLYTRSASDFAQTAAMIQELSGGRFRFGVGVSHAPLLSRMGIDGGKPLGDMRKFVEGLRAAKRTGEQPPIVVAGLRKKMVALAGEVGDGVVFANGSRSHMGDSLSVLSDSQRAGTDFFIGNMIPTCISDDLAAAAAVNKKTLTFYVTLPNYRNYWKEAGYVEEMEAIEKAIAAGEQARIPELMSDAWLSDCTLYGPQERVLEGLAAWYEAGIRTPILVPSSAAGNQLKAFEELFALF